MPPTVIRMPAGTEQNSGFRIGCCRVCTCVNLQFFLSKNGILKCFELVLGWFCQTMLIQFGLDTAKDIGEAFLGFLTTCSAFLLTTTILLLCYAISARTFHLVRQSIFYMGGIVGMVYGVDAFVAYRHLKGYA
uniref:MARVEL domain-containing protein n=1 Tax=Anopheles atroparvus TaxID=41427 RepID=A0A182IV35_ANOAO